MIILTQTTDNLEIVLAGSVTTSQLNCMASYRDITTTGFTPGRIVANTNNTTAVNLVTAPGASTQRVVDWLSVHNNDTANATVTIRFDANGTEYILFRTTLATGEKLEYQEGHGFKVIANSGAIKTSLNQGNSPASSGLSRVTLGSDVTNNNAVANTIANITGLQFPVVAGQRYYFRFVIHYTAAATTTGSRWSINGPTISELRYKASYSLTATSQTIIEGSAAYDLPAASNASSAATGANMAIVEGFVNATANGDVIGRFASEVANSAIVAKAGSFVEYVAL